MRWLERTLSRELRRAGLPVHIRRQQARRLAAAVEAAGYTVPGPLVPGDPALNRAALQGAQVAVDIVQSARWFSAGVDDLIRRLQGRL